MVRQKQPKIVPKKKKCIGESDEVGDIANIVNIAMQKNDLALLTLLALWKKKSPCQYCQYCQFEGEKVPCKFLMKLTELTGKNLYGKVDQLDQLDTGLCQLCQVGHAKIYSALSALLMVKVQKVQIVQCKNLHENSYPLERLFVRNLRILILRNDYFTNFLAYLRKM